MQALEMDPDNEDIKKAIKNIKRSHDLKEEASKLFKDGKIQPSIDKFNECLEIDEMNIHYNATCLLNIAIGNPFQLDS